MSDKDREEDDERTISLDDLENSEHEREQQDSTLFDEDDWGESFDDLDSEAWEKQYGQGDEEVVEPDPWDLG